MGKKAILDPGLVEAGRIWEEMNRKKKQENSEKGRREREMETEVREII